MRQGERSTTCILGTFYGGYESAQKQECGASKGVSGSSLQPGYVVCSIRLTGCKYVLDLVHQRMGQGGAGSLSSAFSGCRNVRTSFTAGWTLPVDASSSPVPPSCAASLLHTRAASDGAPPPPPTMETLCLDDISVLDEVQTGTSYQVQRVASCTHCTREAVFPPLKPFPRQDPIFLA
jgi:hypothetical protein